MEVYVIYMTIEKVSFYLDDADITQKWPCTFVKILGCEYPEFQG